MSELKQLNFVDNGAKRVAGVAENLYGSARGLVPGFLMYPVTFTEGMFGPLYDKAQTLCHNVLVTVDAKVDYGVHKSQDILKASADKTRSVVGEDAAEQFQEAKDTYVAAVSDGYQFILDNGPIKSVSAMIKRRGEAFERVKGILVSTGKFVYSAGRSTIDYTTHQPAVESALNYAKPYADGAQSFYAKFHTTLVHNPQYATLYKLVCGMSEKVLTNKFVHASVDKSKAIVYPYIQFVADPTLETVTPYVDALKEHLKPASEAAEKSEQLPPSKQQANTPAQVQPASKPIAATKVE